MQRLLFFKPIKLFLAAYQSKDTNLGGSSNAYIGDDGVCRLKLTDGQETLIDVEDLPKVVFKTWRGTRIVKRNPSPYAARSERDNNRNVGVLMHRLLLDAETGLEVDHINGLTLDNRRSNLRICTGQQNVWNKPKFSGAFSSKFKGVVWDKECDKWRARIRFNDKLISLGRHVDEEDAARAYDKKALELFGPFAKLNFPQ